MLFYSNTDAPSAISICSVTECQCYAASILCTPDTASIAESSIKPLSASATCKLTSANHVNSKFDFFSDWRRRPLPYLQTQLIPSLWLFHFHSASAQLAMQSAVLAIVNLSVWPSDRLSHAGIMPKRLKLRSRGLHWRIAPWL